MNMGLLLSHNPYFNRWFSAIEKLQRKADKIQRHNPYFNRWFSAIMVCVKNESDAETSQSLF